MTCRAAARHRPVSVWMQNERQAQARVHGDAPEKLLPDRARDLRAARHHALSDLVVRHLGRRLGQALPAAQIHARLLPAVSCPGLRPADRPRRNHADRVPDSQPGRSHHHRLRRVDTPADALHPRDLQRPEADLPDGAVGELELLPEGRTDRIPAQGALVAGLRGDGHERRGQCAADGGRGGHGLGVPADDAQSHLRLSALRAETGDHRPRHVGGRCGQDDHFGRARLSRNIMRRTAQLAAAARQGDEIELQKRA